MITDQKRINVREHTVKIAPHESFGKNVTRVGVRQEGRGEEVDGRKIEWKSSEVNTRVVSRGQKELLGKFKMAAGDVISIGVDYIVYIHSNRY